MALSAGSHSTDTMFDFFEDRADTTANTVEPVDKDGREDKSSHQPEHNTQTLTAMYMGTSDPTKSSGREVTDISFQSIEEVIELAGDSNGTPEIELVDGNSGSLKVEQLGEKIGSPETHSQKLQPTEYKNVSLEKEDHSHRNGTLSVISLLSNISLSENKQNEETMSTHKSHTGESGSTSASLSEMGGITNERDASDTMGLDILPQDTVADTQENSSKKTPVIENELSFSLLKTETIYQKSHHKTFMRNPPSASNLQEMKEGVDFLNKDETKAPGHSNTESGERRLANEPEVHVEKDEADSFAISPLPSVKSRKDLDFSWLTTENDVMTAKSTINTASRPNSNRDPDLSWLTGDKDTQKSESETILLSESQQNTSFSWLKSDGDVDVAESELKIGERNLSRTKSKEEDFSWLTRDKETEVTGSASVMISSSSNPNEAKKEMSWLRSEKDTLKTKSTTDLSPTSSPGESLILPSTETNEKPDSGWLFEKETDQSLSRLHFQDCSPRSSPTEKLSTSKDTKTKRRCDSNAHSESEREFEDILTTDKTSNENTVEPEQNMFSENRGEPEQKILINTKDLNFDFMEKERIEDDTPAHVPTRGATTVSMSQSPSSVHQADTLNVEDKQTESDTQQQHSSKPLTLTTNKDTGPSKVSEAIHSAVALFHHEKGATHIGVSKPAGKQRKKSVHQNGYKQANIRKKTSKINKITTGTIAGSGIKDNVLKNQNMKRVEISKSKNSQKELPGVKVNVESYDKARSKKTKKHKEVETRGKESKNDNGNSNQAVGYQLPVESSGSSDGQTSTMASSDTIIKIDNMSSCSLAYEDDFEEDTRSVKSAASSKAGFDSDLQKKGEHLFPYSSSPYGGIYSAYARQPKQLIRSDNVKFPKINAFNPVQLTSGQISFSEQIFSAAVKRKRKSKKKEIYLKDSYENKASSESDSKPEISLRKNERVPVSLKAEAVYRKGRLEIAVVDDRQALSEGANMDVRITVLHKHLNGLQAVRNRPRNLPKLNFAANRDVLNHRAAFPPFNTYTDKHASERFRQAFGM
ncbi:hypothetical protein KP79_PYT01966 [Mizuhopecten yessoensis]|uniref:Uncharacterized protein n=1 Tax=Mizuhopecten yessoensis TaxID=6573 RepID=A0A210Q2Q8_MIZYE|nr:hypothetical protein KP79_PYT01966 [Mizuhopecten yessoensis]